MSTVATAEVRVTLSIAHRQDVGVISHADDGFMPVVVVRTGPVVTTCDTFRAIGTAAYAWASAQHRARAVFPAGFVGRAPVPVEGCSVQDVQVTVKAAERQGFNLRGSDAKESVDGWPYVSVLVGPVLVRALDVAAVDSVAHAWRTAYRLALVLFAGDGPDPASPPPRFYE
jgi:hypothetical protein